MAPPAGCGECVTARLHNHWCGDCDFGWVAGEKIESRALFETLDAHGHDVDPSVMKCEGCKALAVTGGFCEPDRFGWVAGQAYMSRLTYHMALGEVRDPGQESCGGCRAAAPEDGWCDKCQVGWAGNARFGERGEHRAAAHEIVRLRTAVRTAKRCETCAMMVIYDGKCPHCKIAFVDGLPAED